MTRAYELVDRVREYNPHTDEDLLLRAYVFGAQVHGGQLRADGKPYFTGHPLEVAAILTELKLDDATIVTALLHDTLEDTEATPAEIERLFGPEILRLVDGVTKLTKLELSTAETAQAENFRKLLIATAKDVRVLAERFTELSQEIDVRTELLCSRAEAASERPSNAPISRAKQHRRTGSPATRCRPPKNEGSTPSA